MGTTVLSSVLFELLLHSPDHSSVKRQDVWCTLASPKDSVSQPSLPYQNLLKIYNNRGPWKTGEPNLFWTSLGSLVKHGDAVQDLLADVLTGLLEQVPATRPKTILSYS